MGFNERASKADWQLQQAQHRKSGDSQLNRGSWTSRRDRDRGEKRNILIGTGTAGSRAVYRPQSICLRASIHARCHVAATVAVALPAEASDVHSFSCSLQQFGYHLGVLLDGAQHRDQEGHGVVKRDAGAAHGAHGKQRVHDAVREERRPHWRSQQRQKSSDVVVRDLRRVYSVQQLDLAQVHQSEFTGMYSDKWRPRHQLTDEWMVNACMLLWRQQRKEGDIKMMIECK